VHAAHHFHEHERDPATDLPIQKMPSPVSDRIAITSLFALLTFSPCESFVPFYVAGMRYGWLGFVLLTAILSVATVIGMLVFTWLTLAGLRQINLRALEKFELGIMGLLLCAVGMLIILFEP
jgi:hypothetical protein